MNRTFLTEKTVNRILEFWFGNLDESGIPTEEYRKRWWVKDPRTDNLIKDMFRDDLEYVKSRYSKDIILMPRESLAIVILLDQFSRNIYRELPEAFSSDYIALGIALEGIEEGLDEKLLPIKRIFYYMPLMHCEDSRVHKISLKQFKKLEDAYPEPLELYELLKSSRIYAEKHAAIISRFGRYPHRNKILGRESTKEEIEFLKQPGSSF